MRIEFYGDKPECRIRLRQSFEASEDALRGALPPELVLQIENATAVADIAALRDLVPRFREFLRTTR